MSSDLTGISVGDYPEAKDVFEALRTPAQTQA